MRKGTQRNLNDIKMNYTSAKLSGETRDRIGTRNISGFDRLDILILTALLKNPDVKSSEIF